MGLGPIYQNRIIFAKDLSNKIFSPPRHQDAEFNYNKQVLRVYRQHRVKLKILYPWQNI